MHSATDHGYGADWSIQIVPGLVVRHLSAEGNNQLRVVRRHRDFGFWECVWVDGPRERGIWVCSEREILADAYAN